MLDSASSVLVQGGKGLQLHHVCFAITWVTSRVHYPQIRHLRSGNASERMSEMMRQADVELLA